MPIHGIRKISPIAILRENYVVFRCEAARLVYAAYWHSFCRRAALPMNADTPAATSSLVVFIGSYRISSSIELL